MKILLLDDQIASFDKPASVPNISKFSLKMILCIALIFCTLVNPLPLPDIIHQMSTMPFSQAYRVSKENKYFFETHNIVSNFEKAKIEALVHHNGRLHDGTGAIKFILEMSVSDRFKYLYHLLKNPTVDLSANENYLAKKLVNDGDNHAISVLLNNPKIDLSFDGNHLLKIASSRNDIDMVHLLLQDMNVQNVINLSIESDLNDELGISQMQRSDHSDIENISKASSLTTQDSEDERIDALTRTILKSRRGRDSDDDLSVNVDSISVEDDYKSIDVDGNSESLDGDDDDDWSIVN